MDDLINVRDLKVYFYTSEGVVPAVDGVSFSIKRGETLCIVGESGCGKSVTALSLIKLVQVPPGRYVEGSVLYQGEDILRLKDQDLRKIRGNEIAMIFQEPMTSLNPVYTIGDQIAEAIVLHQGLPKAQAMDKAGEMLQLAGISDPLQRIDEYPHQLSGGMRQRAMIAMALSCDPKLLIADEPTTALDVTIQAQILELIKNLKHDLGMAVMLITHDLGVVAEMADRVLVMYAGKIVEEADKYEIFEDPWHPYTMGLHACIPRIDQQKGKLNVIEGSVPSPLHFPTGCRFHDRCQYAQDSCATVAPELVQKNGRKIACHFYESIAGGGGEIMDPTMADTSELTKGNHIEPLLDVVGLCKYFPIKGGLMQRVVGHVHAVDGVSFSVPSGTTFGLVGESGCGKTTVGRTILRLISASSGSVKFNGMDLLQMPLPEFRKIRRQLQIVFQDPFGSLNPRQTVGQIIGEVISYHGLAQGKERDKLVGDLLRTVSLHPDDSKRFPHEFSGGQRQRIGIARAIALRPKLIICDEPVSALDVSVQSQILNLLQQLQADFDLTYIFIAHGLNVIKHISDTVGVMYLGKIVEIADSHDFFQQPLHPYSKALLSAVPIPNPRITQERIILSGDVPSPVNPPSGCRFHGRCRYATKRCSEEEPILRQINSIRQVACHLVG